MSGNNDSVLYVDCAELSSLHCCAAVSDTLVVGSGGAQDVFFGSGSFSLHVLLYFTRRTLLFCSQCSKTLEIGAIIGSRLRCATAEKLLSACFGDGAGVASC